MLRDFYWGEGSVDWRTCCCCPVSDFHSRLDTTYQLRTLMIGPRRAEFSQFGGLTGDVESGARKRQGMAEARRMAEVSAKA